MDGGYVAAHHLPLHALTITTARPNAHLLASARDAIAGRLAALGLRTVIVDDWRALLALNRQQREGWFALLPKPRDAPAFWLAAVDTAGDIVATHAAVLVDCRTHSFGERLADLSAFHDAGEAPAEDWCFCASDAAFETCGMVAWIVAGWTRPDWRGRGLFHVLGAAVRLVCCERWAPRWWVGLVDPETVPVWSGRSAGRRLLEPRPRILFQQSGVGRLPLHLLRYSRQAVLLDLKARTSVPHAELNRREHGTPIAA